MRLTIALPALLLLLFSTAATPAAAQNTLCTPDANGRFSRACLEAERSKIYKLGVKAGCEAAGGRYYTRSGKPRCARRAQREQENPSSSR